MDKVSRSISVPQKLIPNRNQQDGVRRMQTLPANLQASVDPTEALFRIEACVNSSCSCPNECSFSCSRSRSPFNFLEKTKHDSQMSVFSTTPSYFDYFNCLDKLRKLSHSSLYDFTQVDRDDDENDSQDELSTSSTLTLTDGSVSRRLSKGSSKTRNSLLMTRCDASPSSIGLDIDCAGDNLLNLPSISLSNDSFFDGDELPELLSKAFDGQNILAKTIKSQDWEPLLQSLSKVHAEESTFMTSSSLIPPWGKHMKLFGDTREYILGLFWDYGKLEHLQDKILAWPSGYYAKSEFNLDRKTGRLSNGRDKHLVTLDMLRDSNKAFISDSAAIIKGKFLAFNEVLLNVNTDALCGIFSRSMEHFHLISAIGMKQTISRLFNKNLPIFYIDPVAGVIYLSNRHENRILRNFVNYAQLNKIRVDPFTLNHTVDLTNYPWATRSKENVVHFYGSVGCSDSAFKQIVHSTQYDQAPQEIFAKLVGIGLRSSVETNNVHTGELIVRKASPFVLAHKSYYVQRDVDWLCHESRSSRMLVILGAYRAIGAVSTGQTFQRLKDATDALKSWLFQSNNLLFRLDSWKKLCDHGKKDANFFTFLSGKAIENRQNFCSSLQELQKCAEQSQFLMQCSKLVSQMHHPCLRLELLQYILGLDYRWSLDMVMSTCKLALDIVCESQKEGLIYSMSMNNQIA